MRCSAGLAAALLGASLCASCGSLPFSFPGVGPPQISEEDLRADTTRAARVFALSITGTADAIAERSSDRAIQRRALLWKIRIVPLVQAAARASKATASMIQLLVVAAAQRAYLTEGVGATLFGPQQPLAERSARDIESQLQTLPVRLLGKQRAQELQTEVEHLAREFPVHGEFAIETAQGALPKIESSRPLQSVLALPLAPFRAIEGVESGASAMHAINATARQMNEVFAATPEQVRWQLELFTYEIEDHQKVEAALAEFARIAESSERFAAVAADLPQSLRREVLRLLSDSPQGDVSRTLAALQTIVAGAGGVLGEAQPLASTLERTAAHVEQATGAWAEIAARFDERLGSAKGSGGVSPALDVREYERAAEEVGAAAAQIRELLAELPEASSSSIRLADRLFWRGLILLLVWFGLLLVYRRLAR